MEDVGGTAFVHLSGVGLDGDLEGAFESGHGIKGVGGYKAHL
jgi:hypothetical protein